MDKEASVKEEGDASITAVAEVSEVEASGDEMCPSEGSAHRWVISAHTPLQ